METGTNKNKAPHPVDVHVGAKIRQRRTMLGVSQEKLADSLDLTFQQIQKYETGRNRVSASRLYEIGEILDTDISHFFDGFSNNDNNALYGLAENKQASYGSAPKDIMNEKETLELIKAYYAIDDVKLRKSLVKTMKQIAKTTD